MIVVHIGDNIAWRDQILAPALEGIAAVVSTSDPRSDDAAVVVIDCWADQLYLWLTSLKVSEIPAILVVEEWEVNERMEGWIGQGLVGARIDRHQDPTELRKALLQAFTDLGIKVEEVGGG